MEEKLIAIGGMQKHQSIRSDGICPCLTSSMGMGGGYVPIIIQIENEDGNETEEIIQSL